MAIARGHLALVKLAEECAELSQIVCKALLFPPYTKRTEIEIQRSLEAEIADTLAAIEWVCDHCGVDRVAVEQRKKAKIELWRPYHDSALPPPTNPPNAPIGI